MFRNQILLLSTKPQISATNSHRSCSCNDPHSVLPLRTLGCLVRAEPTNSRNGRTHHVSYPKTNEPQKWSPHCDKPPQVPDTSGMGVKINPSSGGLELRCSMPILSVKSLCSVSAYIWCSYRSRRKGYYDWRELITHAILPYRNHMITNVVRQWTLRRERATLGLQKVEPPVISKWRLR